MRKTLALSALGVGIVLASEATAFSPPCANYGNTSCLTAVNARGGFYVGLVGAWLQPTTTGTGLNHLVLGEADADGNVATSFIKRIDPEYKWAWGFEVGYDLPCSAYNLELDYFHIDNKSHVFTDKNGFASGGTFFLNENFVFGEIADASPTRPIVVLSFACNTDFKYKLDQLDLKFGRQYDDVCNLFTLKPSIGARYAKIDQQYRSVIDSQAFDAIGLLPGPIIPSPFAHVLLNDDIHSKFNGIGPLLALDVRYGFCGGFGIIGHFDGAFILGQVKSHTTSAVTAESLAGPGGPVIATETSNTRLQAPSTDRIVTNFNGKIGLDYTYCFCNKSSLTVEAGYLASKYYGAVDLVRGNTIAPTNLVPARSSAALITNTDTDDFEFRGPYLNITWHM